MDAVVNVGFNVAVDIDKEVDNLFLSTVDGFEKRFQEGAVVADLEVGQQFLALGFGVLDGVVLGLVIDKEVEGILDVEAGDEVDFEREVIGLFGEGDAGEEVAEGVLLPVEVVGLGSDFKRVRLDGGAGVDGGTETNDVRRHRDAAVVFVSSAVIECDSDSHVGILNIPWRGFSMKTIHE